MARWFTCFGSIILTLALVATAQGQEKKDTASGEKSSAGQTVDGKTAADKSAIDPSAVPEGTPKELVEFIQKIILSMPADDEVRKKIRKAALEAADKILADKPNQKELNFAVQAKIHLLEKAEEIKALGEELKKAGREKQARIVAGFCMENDMKTALMSGTADMKSEIEQALKFLGEGVAQESDMGLAIMIGQIAELQGNNDYAIEVYRQLGKIFSAGKDEQLVKYGKRFEGVVRRLSLPGNQMQLEGKLLTGEQLDYAKYKGKVVLVDFWATWCSACLAEIPNLKKNYEVYHDKGFDIIGFSCDYMRKDLEQFVKEKDIPWAIVFGDDEPSPTVEYYGILGVPMMLLVGKDGSVIDLDIRGEQLGKRLEEILGPIEEKKNKQETDVK